MKKTLKLYEIQNSLMNSITGLRSEQLVHIVCEKPPISTEQRIRIYQDAYRIRMLESLRDDFSRVEEKLGEDEFKRVAMLFIEKHPSTYASLAEVSQSFPQFIKRISYELHELASVDWIEILSDKARRLDLEKIVSVQEIESGVPFRLLQNPTLFVFKGREKISIAYRSSDSVYIKEILPVEFEILDILKTPMTVDELSSLLEKIKVELEETQSLISTWIKNEIILCERISYA